MTKFFSGFLICISLSILLVLFLKPNPIFLDEKSDHQKLLENLWQKDVEVLRMGGHLHPGFDQIKEVQFIPSTEQSVDWVKNLAHPFEIKPEGQFFLEVLVLDWTDEDRKGVILQLNLTEIASKNLVFEIGRTYYLAGSSEETEKLLSTTNPDGEPSKVTSEEPAATNSQKSSK